MTLRPYNIRPYIFQYVCNLGGGSWPLPPQTAPDPAASNLLTINGVLPVGGSISLICLCTWGSLKSSYNPKWAAKWAMVHAWCCDNVSQSLWSDGTVHWKMKKRDVSSFRDQDWLIWSVMLYKILVAHLILYADHLISSLKTFHWHDNKRNINYLLPL